MKTRFIQFIFPVVFAASVSVLAVTALASSTEKPITVVFRNIKLFVEGALYTPKDASGATVEPFIYNGSVYLPARAVSEALGKTVTWDAATDSVFINTPPLPTYIPSEQIAPEPDYRMEGNDIIRRVDFKIGYENQPIDLPEIPSTDVEWQILTIDNPNNNKSITYVNNEYINADPTADAVTHRFNFKSDRSAPIGANDELILTVTFGQFLNGREIGYKTICHCYILSGYGWD